MLWWTTQKVVCCVVDFFCDFRSAALWRDQALKLPQASMRSSRFQMQGPIRAEPRDVLPCRENIRVAKAASRGNGEVWLVVFPLLVDRYSLAPYLFICLFVVTIKPSSPPSCLHLAVNMTSSFMERQATLGNWLRHIWQRIFLLISNGPFQGDQKANWKPWRLSARDWIQTDSNQVWWSSFSPLLSLDLMSRFLHMISVKNQDK